MSAPAGQPHPHLTGRIVDAVDDVDAAWPVARASVPFESGYLDLVVDDIVGPDGVHHTRSVVHTTDSVMVLAIDDADRVLFVQQYRHPMRRRMAELPAGKVDVAGESPLQTARRELAEEADLVAEHWTPGPELVAASGYSTESFHLFTATGLRPVPETERTVREAEEADMEHWWVPFDVAVECALTGRVKNAATCTSLLAQALERARR